MSEFFDEFDDEKNVDKREGADNTILTLRNELVMKNKIIENLQDEVERLKKDVEELKSRISEKESEIKNKEEECKKKLEEQKKLRDEAEVKIKNLVKVVKAYKGQEEPVQKNVSIEEIKKKMLMGKLI